MALSKLSHVAPAKLLSSNHLHKQVVDGLLGVLARVGDHAVNIAEDGIFLESATDIRHLGPEKAAEEIESN